MINIAIIGFGGIGHYHYRLIRDNLKNARVTGIYDTNSNLKKECEEKNLYFYQSKEELYQDKNVDLCLVSTPNDVHKQYVIELARAKKHVLCEKPVAMNLKELEEMEKEAIGNNVIFTVHQNRRFDKDYLTMKKIYDEKLIGEIYDIETFVNGSTGIPGGWRKLKKHGGGMLFDWGVHKIDQFVQLIESPVTSVYAEFYYPWGHEVEDTLKITLGFENHFKAHITINTNNFLAEPIWKAFGIGGTAVIYDWDVTGKIINPVNALEENQEGIVCSSGFSKTVAPRSKDAVKEQKLPEIKEDYSMLWKNLIKNIEAGTKDVFVTIDGVKRVMKIMEACFRSAELNQVIKTNI